MKVSPFRALLILVILCLTHSCGSDIDIIPDQQDKIISYLEKKGYEYTIVGGTYRYIHDVEDKEVYDALPEAVVGDEIKFKFFAYTFDSAPRGMFYSNVAPSELDPEVPGYSIGDDWSTDPYSTIIGSGTLMKAIEDGLPGCKVGDRVELYITSDLAYGDIQLGLVQPNTTLLYDLIIISIN